LRTTNTISVAAGCETGFPFPFLRPTPELNTIDGVGRRIANPREIG
jgi:hypothetical protein